jgi:hypothetical protein
MAVSSTYFLNAADLTSATAVYTDFSLTNKAPDGAYSDGTISRQQIQGVLSTSEACPSPCPTPCGTSISGSGGSGIYQIALNVGGTPESTGAIIITFNVQSVPDGIRATYDGVVYNKLSSPVNGAFESPNANNFTIVGTSGNTGTCSNWYPNGGTVTQSVFVYNPATSSFDNTGNTETTVIAVNDFSITTNSWGDCKLVIPKVNANPSSLLIEIIGPCSGTGWNFGAICPASLPSFSSSDAYNTANINCTDTILNTYYFAKVHTAADGFVGIYDYVFTDINGQFPLANGFYLTDNVAVPNGVINVQNGVIVAITACLAPTNCTEYQLQNGGSADATYSYTDCSGAFISTFLGGFDSVIICAQTDSVNAESIISITANGPCQ